VDADVVRRFIEPVNDNKDLRDGGDLLVDEYGGLYFKPNLLRVGWIRMRPKWTGKSRRLGGSLKWMTRAVPEKWAQRNGWVTLEPILSGICGSDIAVMYGESSAYLAPLASFPAVLGHEVVARVISKNTRVGSGARVVLDPTLGCAARNEAEWCWACQAGTPSFCVNRGNVVQGAGMLLGYHHQWPGGFSTVMWAPEAQCWPIPEGVSDERAVLAEPLATVLAGLDQLNVRANMNVLVIGAGTIGLLAIWACQRLWNPQRLHVLARHPHQVLWAKRLGADKTSADDDFDANSQAVLGRPFERGKWGAPSYYPRGYDVVINAVGTQGSIIQGLAQVKPGGQLLQLGGAAFVKADLTALWARGIHWTGTFGYHDHRGQSTFPWALSWLQAAPLPIEQMVTHRYSFHQYKKALQAIRDPRQATIKVVLSPN
jgi:threonine dehydrogenase-like Zn-dependent dehydrogenase